MRTSRRAGTISIRPKWKGKLLSDDMRPLGSGNALFSMLQKNMDAEFNEKLAEQKPGLQPRHAQ